MSKLNWEAAKRKELQSSNPRPKSTLQQKLDKALEQGAKRERQRIVKLLKANIGRIEALEYEYWADELADLISGKDPGREDNNE